MNPKVNEKGADSPLLDQALQLIEAMGWAGFTLVDLSQSAQVSLPEIYSTFPTKESVIEALSTRVDREVLGQISPSDFSQSPKDRLFEILMLRFETLSAHKRVIQSMWDGSIIDPLSILPTLPKGLHSVKWMLDVSGHDTTGVCGAIKIKVFAFLYLSVISDWLNDDSEDLVKTMASLDKMISRIETYTG